MNKRIDAFLDQVCIQVKYKRIHKELKRELCTHLQDKIQFYQERGMNEEEAIERTIHQMGDPIEIGKGLHETHRPKVEWWIIALIGAVVLIGAMILFSIVKDPVYQLPLGYILPRYLTYVAMGIGAGVAMYFFDYTQLEKYALPIYVGALLLLLFTASDVSIKVNGRGYIHLAWFQFAPTSVILPFFLIPFAWLLKRWGTGQMKDMLKLVGLAGAAVVLCLSQSSLVSAMLLGCGFLVMFTVCMTGKDFRGNHKLFLGALYGGSFVASLLYLIGTDYRVARLMGFFNRQLDPQGAGYIYGVASKIFDQAKWIGRGEGLYLTYPDSTQHFAIPEVNTDMVFTYLVGAFGWLAGIAVIVVFILVLIRMFMASQRIQNAAGKYVAVAIVTVFALQAAGNILMNLGLIPITDFSLPFISYGGSNFVMNMMLIGFLLGIYRRKDLESLREKALFL